MDEQEAAFDMGLTDEQREQLLAQAATAFDAAQAADGGGQRAMALGNYAEAATIYLALRDDGFNEAMSSMVQFMQTLDQDEFDTLYEQLDDQHRQMLDALVAYVQGSDDEDEDEPGGVDVADLTPEQRLEMLGRARSQLDAAQFADQMGDREKALASYVEAAIIYIVMEQEEPREEALAGLVGLMQKLSPQELNETAAGLDEQHRNWLIGVMQMLQQRTIEEHEPEIRAEIEQQMQLADFATASGDHQAAVAALSSAFANAASLQDAQLASQLLAQFAQLADEVGPGAIAEAAAAMDERQQMSFQMLLSSLAELRDPSGS